MHRPRLAIVSPFLDKCHGTERIVAEWINHLSDTFEIHVYSQRVDGIDPSSAVWHRIPTLPGPHLANFVWWFAANHAWRGWDRCFRKLRHDIIFSPGANCVDADAISIHIVFAEFLRRVRPDLAFSRNPLRTWPRLLHRKLYYQLAVALERRIYSKPQTQLILTSPRSASEIARFFGRRDNFPVIDAGIDQRSFSVERRAALRAEARRELGILEDDFAVLLIGNDWRKKGLLTLVDAVARLRELPIRLFVVTRESQDVREVLQQIGAEPDRASVLPLRTDVEFYYAAADAYVGPSLEDTFALPVAEGMACGLPVITSQAAGVSQIITDGEDGLILRDDRDAVGLAAMIRRLYDDKEFRERLGRRAAETAQKYTWESSSRKLAAVLEEILARKSGLTARTLAHEA